MGLLVLETIALGIALASPLVPTRTGSHWSPADLVTPDPTYPQEVIASFVAVNLLLAALGVAVVMVRRWAEPTSPDEPEP